MWLLDDKIKQKAHIDWLVKTWLVIVEIRRLIYLGGLLQSNAICFLDSPKPFKERFLIALFLSASLLFLLWR